MKPFLKRYCLVPVMIFLTGCSGDSGDSRAPTKWEYLAITRTGGASVSWTVSASGMTDMLGLSADETEANRNAVIKLGGSPPEHPHAIDVYNVLGAQGWELVSCDNTASAKEDASAGFYICFFKRPVQH